MTGQLCAVLLNPPTTPGDRTKAAVQRAAGLLGYDDVVITNLIRLPTLSSGELAAAAQVDYWRRSRRSVRSAISTADGLLFGWGLLNQLGLARAHAEDQVRWLLRAAGRIGHASAWSVGEARHPSRWHQYTADRHGRTDGGSSLERLQQVLLNRPLTPAESWLPRTRRRPATDRFQWVASQRPAGCREG